MCGDGSIKMIERSVVFIGGFHERRDIEYRGERPS